jgi:hypothetical protein
VGGPHADTTTVQVFGDLIVRAYEAGKAAGAAPSINEEQS